MSKLRHQEQALIRATPQLSGRQLDIAIGRRVFRYEVDERPHSQTGKLDAVYKSELEATDPKWIRLPYFSRDLWASLQVELQVRYLGWKWQGARIGSRWNEPSDVRVILENIDGRTVEAVGRENEALCRAALKAMEASVFSA